MVLNEKPWSLMVARSIVADYHDTVIALYGGAERLTVPSSSSKKQSAGNFVVDVSSFYFKLELLVVIS